ncbi:MAG: hypothetical protein J6X40_03055 [Bacteroidales bacterium]|nr:hypothetical protein [Bacteroidales bacterium]
MRRTFPILLLLFCGWWLTACQEHDGIDFDFFEPPKLDSILGVVPEDLVEAFGEEHFHFGPNPPTLEELSFKVDGLKYVKALRYVFGPDGTPMPSQAAMPPMDMTRYFHHFYNAGKGFSGHRLKTIDPSNNQFLRENDSVFVIGNGNQFTAYYIDSIQEYSSGNPVNAVIVSGTIVWENDTVFKGIKNYRIGKKILRYGHHPAVPSYAPGTIEVKLHEGLCPALAWDTDFQPTTH